MPYQYPAPVAYGEIYVGDIPPYPNGYWWQWPTYPSYNSGGVGWECPKCHYIYAPAKLTCDTCNMAQDLKNWQEEDEKEDG